MSVQTVLGPVSESQLGVTLMHEHITCADWSMRMNFGPRFYEEEAVFQIARGQLEQAKQAGVQTLVDGTPINLGRDIRLIRRVAEATGLHIIASSGFYYQEEPWLQMRDEEQIYALLLEECRHGIAGTGILPGMMKAGVAALGVTPLLRKLLTVTGRVASECGLPIFCHHDPSVKTGPEITALLTASGVPAHRIILGHSGDTNDLAYLESALKPGCYIGIDRLGHCDRGNSLKNCVKLILELSGRGYRNRLLLSHDLAAYLAFWDSWETTKQSDYLNLDVNFTFIHRHVIPALTAGGMTPQDIDELMTGNPYRFFCGTV